MNWYKKANLDHLDQEIMNHPNFKGFHCQYSEGNIGDEILKDYAQNYFYEIIESIPFDLQDKMTQLGISLYPPEDQYSEEFDQWSEQAEEFLDNNGIRWIFVSHDKLYNDDRSMGASYGNYCYYILIPNEIILYEFTDPSEENASGIVYDSRQKQPTRIPIEKKTETDNDNEFGYGAY